MGPKAFFDSCPATCHNTWHAQRPPRRLTAHRHPFLSHHTHPSIHACMHVHIYMHTYTYACMHAFMDVYICTWYIVCMCIRGLCLVINLILTHNFVHSLTQPRLRSVNYTYPPRFLSVYRRACQLASLFPVYRNLQNCPLKHTHTHKIWRFSWVTVFLK